MSNYCISCGKKNSEKYNIHNKCLKNIFSVDYMPSICFSLKEISYKAQETIGKLSISGVQPKLSLRLNKKEKIFDVTEKNGQFILKPQTETFDRLPENENLCMTIFSLVNIKTAEHTLIELKDKSIAYIVKRFDRKNNKKIHFEDFQSVLNLNDKYDGSVEMIGKAIKKYARFPGLDIQEFFKIILMNLIIGNGDAHLKNYGFIYDENGEKYLAPCYDIVCSKLVIKNEEDSAITIDGKKNKIKRENIINLANNFNINKKVLENIFKEIRDSKREIIDFIKHYPYLIDEKTRILNIIKEGFEKFIP